MNDSMAQPSSGLASLDLPGWKSAASWAAAVILSLLFLVSGIWKLTGVQGAAMRMAQAKVPVELSVAAALGFGIVETVAGVWILVPRFRRWGAWLTALLLIAFMIYVGVQYNALQGEDCSCFPWLKRVVGPMFFISDGLMLVAAVVAGLWSRRPSAKRSAALVLAAVAVFGGVMFGVERVRALDRPAPAAVTVNGQPYAIDKGRILVFFFHPMCTHCFASAQAMSQMKWRDTRVVAVPVEMPQYGPGFLSDTGLNAALATDFDKIKAPFGYSTYPYAVAVENGRQKAVLTRFDDREPAQTLRKLGMIE